MDTQTRALTTQRAYRARKAQYLAELEERVRKAEEENVRLREDLANARASAANNTTAHVRNTAAAAAELMQNLTATSASLARFQEIAFPAFPLTVPPPPQASGHYSTSTPTTWPPDGPSSVPAGLVRTPSASSQFSDRPPHSHSSSSELSAEYYAPHTSGAHVVPSAAGSTLSGPSSLAHGNASATRLSIANLVEGPRRSADPRDPHYAHTLAGSPPVAGSSTTRSEGPDVPLAPRAGFGFADAYGEPVPPRPHARGLRQLPLGNSGASESESEDLVDDLEGDDDGTMEDDRAMMPRPVGHPGGRGRYGMR